MPVVTISSALGVNCWSTHRFTGHCHRCARYDTCKYPERVASEAYDQVRATAVSLRQQSDALYAALKEM